MSDPDSLSEEFNCAARSGLSGSGRDLPRGARSFSAPGSDEPTLPRALRFGGRGPTVG